MRQIHLLLPPSHQSSISTFSNSEWTLTTCTVQQGNQTYQTEIREFRRLHPLPTCSVTANERGEMRRSQTLRLDLCGGEMRRTGWTPSQAKHQRVFRLVLNAWASIMAPVETNSFIRKNNNFLIHFSQMMSAVQMHVSQNPRRSGFISNAYIGSCCHLYCIYTDFTFYKAFFCSFSPIFTQIIQASGAMS